jgi:hypothetical protein
MIHLTTMYYPDIEHNDGLSLHQLRQMLNHTEHAAARTTVA